MTTVSFHPCLSTFMQIQDAFQGFSHYAGWNQERGTCTHVNVWIMTLNSTHSLGDLNSCPYLLPTFELHCWRGHWAVWPSRCCWWYLWGRRGHRCKIDPWHQAASPDVCRESGSLNFNCNFSMPFPAHCPDLLQVAGYTWLYDYKWKTVEDISYCCLFCPCFVLVMSRQGKNLSRALWLSHCGGPFEWRFI